MVRPSKNCGKQKSEDKDNSDNSHQTSNASAPNVEETIKPDVTLHIPVIDLAKNKQTCSAGEDDKDISDLKKEMDKNQEKSEQKRGIENKEEDSTAQEGFNKNCVIPMKVRKLMDQSEDETETPILRSNRTGASQKTTKSDKVGSLKEKGFIDEEESPQNAIEDIIEVNRNEAQERDIDAIQDEDILHMRRQRQRMRRERQREEAMNNMSELTRQKFLEVMRDNDKIRKKNLLKRPVNSDYLCDKGIKEEKNFREFKNLYSIYLDLPNPETQANDDEPDNAQLYPPVDMIKQLEESMGKMFTEANGATLFHASVHVCNERKTPMSGNLLYPLPNQGEDIGENEHLSWDPCARMASSSESSDEEKEKVEDEEDEEEVEDDETE